MLERARDRSPCSQQVDDHAGVEVAGARAHHEPAGRGEAHGGVDAAARRCTRDHARAVAEVRDDRPAERARAERADDVLVRQPVEAVAAHARSRAARQRQALRDLGQRRGGTRCRSTPPAAASANALARRVDRARARPAGAAARAATSSRARRARVVDARRRDVMRRRRARRDGRRRRAAVPPLASSTLASGRVGARRRSAWYAAASTRAAAAADASAAPRDRASPVASNSANLSDDEPTLSTRTASAVALTPRPRPVADLGHVLEVLADVARGAARASSWHASASASASAAGGARGGARPSRGGSGSSR